MTIQELAKAEAITFIAKYIEEHDFETFRDMKRCYQYDTEDLKDEIGYMLKEICHYASAYQEAIKEVLEMLNDAFGTNYSYERDFSKVHDFIEKANIKFDENGNIIKYGD